MSEGLTRDQKRAVEVWDRDISVLAGAGTGKTRMLAARFVGAVVQGLARPTEILAISFTERAAREMKERIRLAFQEAAASSWEQELEAAQISTFHGFCARLLREHAIQAGVDPSFEILNELEARRAQSLVAEAVFSSLVARDDERLESVVSQLVLSPGERRGPERAFIELYQRIRGTGIKAEGCAQLIDIDLLSADTYQTLEQRLAGLEGERSRSLAKPAALAVADRLLGVREFLSAGWREVSAQRALTRLRDLRSSLKLVHSKDGRALNAAIKEIRDDSLPRLEGVMLEELSRPAKTALQQLLAEFHRHYSQWKMNRRLDFSDLEIGTRDLLSANPQVADQVRQRFRYILVDEFQDTNRLQKEILDFIRTPGNLFVVGDLRQSIYGFRNAEIEVFENYHRQTLASGGATIILRDNFRSRRELIEFVNLAFSPSFQRQWEWDAGELSAASEFDEKDVPSVEFILARGEDAAAARTLEAQTLARRIAELVSDGRYGYRDFALLLRSTTNMKVYERALSKAEIPFYVQAGRGLFNAREVVDLLCLLKVLSNPGDDVSLAGVLRSPFVGCNDDTLFWLARHARGNSRRVPLIQAVREVDQVANLNPKERDLLIRFLHDLEKLRARQGRVPLAQLVSDALMMTGYLRAASFGPEGARIHANLRKLTEFARLFEERGIFDLGDFLSLVRDFYLREVREPEALLSAEKEDVVKLMTVHAAKGMEFPVVAVLDLNWGRPALRPALLFSPDIGLGFRLLDDPDKSWSLSYRTIMEQREERERAESVRLLYVAATRAKDQLIFSAGVGKRINQGSWLDHFQSVMNLDISTGQILSQSLQGKVTSTLASALPVPPEGEEPVSPWPGRILNIQPGKADFTPEIERQGEQIMARVTKPMPRAEAGHYLATASELLMFNSCPRLYYLRHCLLLPEQLGQLESTPLILYDDVSRGQDELTASMLGSAAHKVLHDYCYQDSLAGLTPVVQDALATSLSGEVPSEAAETISGWVSSFYASSLGKRVMASSEVMKEVDFIFRLEGLLIKGRIDLILRENGGYSIIDYKSDQVTGTRLEERARQYQLQLLIYALAGAALFGDYPREARLYFLRIGQTWPVPLTSQEIEGARQCIRQFNAAFETRQFPPHPSVQCGFCAYKGMAECS